MAEVEKLNINSTDYDIADAKALRNKTTAGTGTFVDNRAGNTTHTTSGSNLTNSIIIGNTARFTSEGSSYSFVTVLGAQASALGSYTTAFGAQSVASAQYALACGYAAQATALSSTAYGYSARATAQNATAVGSTARATATNAIALGINARATAANAIQIGSGTNNNERTVQIKNWQLLDADGYIPEERLPLGLRSAGVNPTNLYSGDLEENQVSEQVFLYTGDTNSFLTKDMYYRGAIRNSRPIFEVTGVEPALQAITDVKIDQQKLFEKIAAVSKDRIDNDNIANSIVGGDDSIQSVIFGYNATSHLWFIYFEETGFESVYQTVPEEIADITETELENDYGVYINKEHFVPVAGVNDVFYVNYYAPNYCTSIGYDEADFTINYMKFMTAMCSNVYGFGYAIPNMETWSYVVDGTTYTMPIIPNEYNGYSDVTVRFEWDGMQSWEIIINGDSTGEFASTDLMAEEFGINIDATYEQDISYIELSFEPAKQRRWEQFVPATAGNGITLDGGVISLEDDVVTDVKIHNVSKVVNKVADLSVVEQVEEFPTVTLDNTGLIVQYIGDTTSGLVHAYFYEAIITLQHRTTTDYGIRIYDQTRFANFLKQDVGSEGKNVSYFTVNRDSQSNMIKIRCYSTDGPFSTVHSYTDATFPTTGLTSDETVGGAIATFSTGFGWTQTDVQPSGGSDGYHPDLFDVKWADHICNDVQWLRADTFSWQSGAVYQVAYQHLADDIDGKTLQSETIGSTTIQFYLADDGHKICPASEESNVTAIYNATGVAWYYIIDTTNQRFKLPRAKPLTGAVIGNGMTLGLTDGINTAGLQSNSSASTGLRNELYGTSVGTSGGAALTNGVSFGITSDPTKSGIIAERGNTDQCKYLYFYVGEFTQNAVFNTAGLNAELFNTKADASTVATATAHVVTEFQEPTSANNYTWYRKYKDGWVEQGGQNNTGNTTINLPVEMANTDYVIVGVGFTVANYGGQTILSKTTTSFSTASSVTLCWTEGWTVSGKAAV